MRKIKKQTDIGSVTESDLLQCICETEESLKIMEIVHSLNEPYKEIFMLPIIVFFFCWPISLNSIDVKIVNNNTDTVKAGLKNWMKSIFGLKM